MWGNSIFQSHLRPKEWGHSIPPNFWNLLLYARTYYEKRQKTTKFCMVSKVDVRQIFTQRPRMLTHNLFAVVNLLVIPQFFFVTTVNTTVTVVY